MFPNSAPDSLTPKNLNLVWAAGHSALDGAGGRLEDEEIVLVGGGLVVGELGVEEGGAEVGFEETEEATPGMH